MKNQNIVVMILQANIHSIKKIKINKKYITSASDFRDVLLKGGVQSIESFRYITIDISKIEKKEQNHLDWIIAMVYARCRVFSVIVESKKY